MFLALPNDQLKNIKEAAVYKAGFQFLGVQLALAADTPDVVEVFSALYRNFLVEPHPAPHISCYINKKAGTVSKPIALVNDTAYELFTDELFLSHAHMIVFQQVLDHIENHMLIHAGVVARDGRGIIISGPSTYGKSTLMLEMVSRGFKFYSDEFCPVNLTDYTISAFPRSIGLRESNPFLNRLDKRTCLLMKNIGRGTKYLVDCEDIFPDSRGSYCKAQYLILLCNKQHSTNLQNSSTIDLALYHDDQTIVDEICQHTGIELTGTYIESDYVVYRFSIALHNGMTKKFRDICSRYSHKIFYQERVTRDEADFTAAPYLQPISRSAASLELLKNIRNRSSCSKLLDKFNHKSSQLLMAIGDLLNGVECYEMTTGPLNEMADMIELQYQKG
jgi:hypothetical protein